MKHLLYTPYVLFISVALAVPVYGQQVPLVVSTAVKAASQNIPPSARMYPIAFARSAAKEVLNRRLIYEQEVHQASQLYHRISQLSDPFPFSEQLRQDIQANVINRTLKKNMLAYLDQGNQLGMLNALADYYHLSPKYLSFFATSPYPEDTFSRDALAYIRRNPHKPNWALRQILKTPGIDEDLKNQIREMLKLDKLPAQKWETYHSLLRAAYRQYLQTLNSAQKAPEVLETLEIYKQLGEDMAVFTATHNRAPRWEIQEERDLFNRFETLLYFNKINRFELIGPHLERLYMFAEEFPSYRMGLDEQTTLNDLKHFWQEHGKLPRSVYQRNFTTQLPNEALLYEAMIYWKKHSKTFFNKLIEETTVPATDSPFYPPYY